MAKSRTNIPELFQSTPSARRATLVEEHLGREVHGISIHALREEGDLTDT